MPKEAFASKVKVHTKQKCKGTNKTSHPSVHRKLPVCSLVTRGRLRQDSANKDCNEGGLPCYRHTRSASKTHRRMTSNARRSRRKVIKSTITLRVPYNLRSTKHGSVKIDGNKRSQHTSISKETNQSKLLRAERSIQRRNISKSISTTDTQKTSVVAKLLASYDIRVKTELIKCWITGIAVTHDGRILAVDRNNRNVKAFSKRMDLLSSLSLDERLWGITIINDGEALVGGDMNYLTVIDISGDQLNIIRNYPLDFRVYGACKFNDKLIAVTYAEFMSVKMFDLSGRVYWSLSDDLKGRRIWPLYATLYNYDSVSSVVVADQDQSKVLFINRDDGSIEKEVNLKGKTPKCVTTDTNGNVYVCVAESFEVVVLNDDMQDEKVLLATKEKPVKRPHAIVYDNNARCLIISYMHCDFLDVYKLP